MFGKVGAAEMFQEDCPFLWAKNIQAPQRCLSIRAELQKQNKNLLHAHKKSLHNHLCSLIF